jgi:putative oxidoreductase
MMVEGYRREAACHRRLRWAAAGADWGRRLEPERIAVARSALTGRRRRSGGDTAALLLRFTLGPMLAYHGYNKVAGPGGLDGTTGWFDALGLKPAHVHARLAAATEIGAGVGVTFGLASPAPAAAAIGLMTVADRTDHKGKGFFVFKGGWEYTGVVAGAAAALAALGPGRWSIDGARGGDRHGFGWAVAAVAAGGAGAALLLKTSFHPNAPESDVVLE